LSTIETLERPGLNILPLVEVPSWNQCGHALRPFDASQDYYHGTTDDGTPWRVYPAWSETPTHTIETPSGITLHVVPEITGREPFLRFGELHIRGRLIVCKEGEESVRVPCLFRCSRQW
jgi:hypothetical protein